MLPGLVGWGVGDWGGVWGGVGPSGNRSGDGSSLFFSCKRPSDVRGMALPTEVFHAQSEFKYL